MTHEEIKTLIKPGVVNQGLVWADLGAGSGNFTMALDDLLGFEGTIFAVDRKLDILRERLRRQYVRSQIHCLEADLHESQTMLPLLDGVLMANTLHYVKDQSSFLAKILPLLKKGGAFILVEYDREDDSQWVPYPISFVTWQRLALKVGLSLPVELGRVPSIYANRSIYAAVSQWGSTMPA